MTNATRPTPGYELSTNKDKDVLRQYTIPAKLANDEPIKSCVAMHATPWFVSSGFDWPDHLN